ncbi:MAG: GntR family transcriptional regulator [Eubacteriales bacterium]|nr:GntR family transcriptional regulator [Eubacteriales bacterium]
MGANDANSIILKRVSTVDALTDIIAKEIVDGAWEPGVQIKDVDMAEKYGVSRNSIREAFSILVEQGLLMKRANRGVFIPELGKQDIYELYNARMVIELEAIEVLTQKREVTDKMYEAIEDLKKQTVENMRSNQLDTDFKFHYSMINALNNGRLSNMANKFFTEIKIINRQPHLFFPVEFIISEHKKIVHAILSGDIAESRKVLREHMILSIDRQVEELEMKQKTEK